MTNPDQATDKYAELRADVLVYLERCADHFDGTPRLVKRLLAAVQDERESRLKAEAALNEMQGVVERLPTRLRRMAKGTYDGAAKKWFNDLADELEAALARDLQDRPARNSSGDSQGEDTDPFPNLHKEHWIRKDDDDTAY